MDAEDGAFRPAIERASFKRVTPLPTIAALAQRRRVLEPLPPQQRHPGVAANSSIAYVERLLFRAAGDLLAERRAEKVAYWENDAAPQARLYRLVLTMAVPQHRRTQVAPLIDPLIRGMSIGITRSPGGSASGCRRPAPRCSPCSAASAALVEEVARQLQCVDALFTLSSL